jgi:putative ABC transport system permease protein
MKFTDLFILATRSFKNKPLRTFLTILGVGVGIGTVLFLVSFGYGLQNVILSRITTADSLLSLDVSPGVSNLVELNSNNLNRISKISGVTEISRMANLTSQIYLGESTADGSVYAIDQSFFRLNGVNPQVGNIFSSDDDKKAVISSAGAKLFNLNPQDIIGKEIQLNVFITDVNDDGTEEVSTVEIKDKYTIVGVVDDENSSFVFVPLKTLVGINVSKFDQVKVKVSQNEIMNDVRAKIMEQGFLVSSLSDTIDQANKIFSIVQIILFFFGFVALFVSAIGMFNTMTIALLEKTNEIGIMRSIGITGKDLKRIFLLEAGIMGLFGGLGGAIIAYVAGKVVNFGLNILAENLGGKAIDLFYSPTIFVILVVCFSFLVGLLTGVYPSMRASKINPLDALRYK